MSVAIYMEGGGDSGDNGGSRAELRRGMEIFLTEIKEACRERNRRWKLVCCGSRNDAYRGFQNARARRDADIVVLLVDSEGPVGGLSCSAYLAKRDRWALDGVCEDAIHLMVQTMEAWIVADPDALSAYFGQGFQANALPRRPNLEEVEKSRYCAGSGPRNSKDIEREIPQDSSRQTHSAECRADGRAPSLSSLRTAV